MDISVLMKWHGWHRTSQNIYVEKKGGKTHPSQKSATHKTSTKKGEQHIQNQNWHSATMPVYINGSHTRDMLQCGATHIFKPCKWGATPIRPLNYLHRVVRREKKWLGQRTQY